MRDGASGQRCQQGTQQPGARSHHESDGQSTVSTEQPEASSRDSPSARPQFSPPQGSSVVLFYFTSNTLLSWETCFSEETCFLLTPSCLLQVKEERPSPISECGLCMHHPRTPHTSECVFPFGLAPPSPVALMPGPPRPLGSTPPQRPVPHIPPQPPLSASLYQRSIKQEKLDGK